MYGCETWATTKYLLSRLDAFDTWALREILRIPYTCHVSNAGVRRTTGCSPLSHLVTNRRLRLFVHIVCSSSREDHHRALAACTWQVSPDWKRPAGRPSHTWLHAIEADLGPLNFGLATAWRKATTRDEWQHIVDTATLRQSMLWKKKKKRWQHPAVGCGSRFAMFIICHMLSVDRACMLWYRWRRTLRRTSCSSGTICRSFLHTSQPSISLQTSTSLIGQYLFLFFLWLVSTCFYSSSDWSVLVSIPPLIGRCLLLYTTCDVLFSAECVCLKPVVFHIWLDCEAIVMST